jgi:DNA primase
MRLYLDDDRYYCFGCGSKGDVIQWVQDAEGLNVTAALKVIEGGRPIANAWTGRGPTDELVGPHRPAARGETPDLRRTTAGRVRQALQDAWKLYSVPALHRLGVGYLTRRGIGIELLERHTGRAEVGHTPPNPATLVERLRDGGYSEDELIDAGLARRHQQAGPVVDFYRHRALIPLRDEAGAVVGLVGRNVSDPRWPKYVNPPRTHSYDKSVNLYQPLAAPVQADGRVIVVEGILDALAVAVAALRAGRHPAICPVTRSGRELSEVQMRAILELHPSKPVLAFDGDAAGADSARRHQQAFARLGHDVDFARVPAGHDPASWLAETGPDGLDALRGSAPRMAPAGHRRREPAPASIVEEAGALLGISRDLAYDLVARRELPSVRLGRRIVVPRKALEETLLRLVDTG